MIFVRELPDAEDVLDWTVACVRTPSGRVVYRHASGGTWALCSRQQAHRIEAAQNPYAGRLGERNKLRCLDHRLSEQYVDTMPVYMQGPVETEQDVHASLARLAAYNEADAQLALALQGGPPRNFRGIKRLAL